jgi:aspartate 1-decarboxylase
MVGGKIHRAHVTGADLNYVGSITIDADLIDAAGILPYERVQVVNIDNGARLETYVIPDRRGSGTIQINGAAAHHVEVSHLIIVMSYVQMPDAEAREWQPRVVLVDDTNHIASVSRGVAGGVFEAP